MSSYREYPPPELQEAITWLKEGERSSSKPSLEHCRVLLHHLQELILTHHNYFALCRYRASTEQRNVLAKQLYERIVIKTEEFQNGNFLTSSAIIELIANTCLELADIFLEQSGEKKVVVEEVEEALREVLGWKP